MSNKLLLADDSITIQKVVGIIFANEDYELTVVDNGNAALEKAREILPDIILVDALMPGKTGYEVCAEVRRTEALKTTPLLLMTGAFEPFDEEKAKQCGADDYISKPFESQQLIDRVKKLIDMGRQRAAVVPAPESPISVPPQAAAVADDIWAEPAIASFTPQASASAAASLAEEFSVGEETEAFTLMEEAEEANFDDDLWGAFDLEEVTEGESVEFDGFVNEAVTTPDSFSTGNLEVDEVFSFAEDEDETGIVETGPEILPAEPQEFDTGWEPVGEQTFAFQVEPATAAVETPVAFELPVEVETAAAFSGFEGLETQLEEKAEPEIADLFAEMAEPAVAETIAAPSFPEVDLQFAPDEEYVPVPEAVTPAAAIAVEPAAVAAGLTEEQLAAAISRISRDIIEKIVWEVVPDLAEILIKDEIRKIKAGLGN
jgi:DNA-binding response OmpR family regulator